MLCSGVDELPSLQKSQFTLGARICSPLPVDSAGHCTYFDRAVMCLLVNNDHEKNLTCSSVSKTHYSVNSGTGNVFLVVTKRDIKLGREYKIA